jgi:hypothetical protein
MHYEADSGRSSDIPNSSDSFGRERWGGGRSSRGAPVIPTLRQVKARGQARRTGGLFVHAVHVCACNAQSTLVLC